MDEKTYIAIDLKSFYASVECVQRGLDPLGVNLVVADESRTEKTICLAVSPSLKAHGISGRARLFEAQQRVREVNELRRTRAPGHTFTGKSFYDAQLRADPSLELDFIVAPPQMSLYMQVSTDIFGIYMKYVAPEDIHVYSIDEAFIDATTYLKTYKMSARDFTMKLIHEVLDSTGITATAGIAPNMYLCKIAMDVVAKKIPADRDGVRIAELDERSYREILWDHRPLTDFWRVGRGISAKLEKYGMYTMGDVARRSITDENLLYRLFGVNAELLIDHAWGWEPCTIADIKKFRPENNSLSTGQVLSCPYSFEKGKLIVREMTDLLVLDLVDKGLVTDQMVLTVCYDRENMLDEKAMKSYTGEVKADFYGRSVPKEAHGSVNLGSFNSSTRIITDAVMDLYDRIVNPDFTVRRMFVVANHVTPERLAVEKKEKSGEQLSLFEDFGEENLSRKKAEEEELEKERRRQKALIEIQKKYGKNAILKGMNYSEGATTRERNGQVGGHKA